MRSGNAEALEDLIRERLGRARRLADERTKPSAPSAEPLGVWPIGRIAMFDIPFLDLPPLVGAGGTVRLPGSKSISNRVLLLAGLSAGTTVVHDLLDSDDTRVMLDALRALGCGVDSATARLPHHRPRRTACGARGAALSRQRRHRDAAAGGRAGACWRQRTAGASSCRGVPRMHERPIGDLVDALRQLGCAIDYLGNDGYPPLRAARQRRRAAHSTRRSACAATCRASS